MSDAEMHPSTTRLYEAARRLRAITGQSAVARLLNASPQTLKNWEVRGVSKTGAITAQEKIGCSATWLIDGTGAMSATAAEVHQLPAGSIPIPADKFKKIWVIGRGSGGKMPERLWTDGDHPVGSTNEYAEIASADPHAFLCEVVGTSMVPRFNPGEFYLVEPSTEPDIEDDVLVRLADGQTLLKRLLSRRGGYRLGSYNSDEVLFHPVEEVTWVYYVAHPVPRRRIKNRT